MRTIELPPALAERFDRIVSRFAERFGETPEDTRRHLEVSLVQRGLASLEREADEVAPVRVDDPNRMAG